MPINIKLLKKKPHKLYSVDLHEEVQIKELCKFLRTHKDRKLEIKINGKNIKFDSIAGRKRFAAGFESAGKMLGKNTHRPQLKSEKDRRNLNKKVKELEQQVLKAKEERPELIKKLRAQQTIGRLREEADEDIIIELEEDCELLNLKLKASYSIIKAVKKAKTLEDLQKIQKKIKG